MHFNLHCSEAAVGKQANALLLPGWLVEFPRAIADTNGLASGPAVPENSKRNIALTGFMAVGKSAVGRSLARRLKRPFVDLDRVIEKREGMKIREIFERKGENHFRAVERSALAQVLQQDGQVIATGGGVVTDAENVKLLRERSLLVCLTAPPEVLLRRAGNARGRPLLAGANRAERVAELLRQRQANYAQAEAFVDTSNLTVDQVVKKILDLLKAEN